MRRSTLVRGLLLVGVAAAALGHVAYWYLPRARPVDPQRARLGRAIEREGTDWALWIPYPHQNLPRLAGGGAELRRLAEALTAVDDPGGSEGEPISFGPFAVPPARELRVEGRVDGEVEIDAAIYPGLAWVARAAGRIADNPWLSGGPVGTASAPREVGWSGSTWSVRAPGASASPAVAVGSDGADPGPVLGLLELAHAAGPFAAGRYRIARGSGWLGLESLGGGASEGDLGTDGSGLPPSDWLVRRDPSLALVLATGARSRLGRRESGLAIFLDDAAGPDTGPRIELPAVAIFYRDESERWELPGEGLARLLRVDEAIEVDGWWVRGWSRSATERVASMLDGPLPGELESDLATALWVDLALARSVVARVVEVLESIPFVGEREATSWRRWARLLDATTGYREVELVVRGDRTGVVARTLDSDAAAGSAASD